VALLLRRRGIERVRPLAGGYRAWRNLGYPMTGLSMKVEMAVVEPVVSGGVNA
jgi:3-mercaptopyruvate sulfurtransferase SseA